MAVFREGLNHILKYNIKQLNRRMGIGGRAELMYILQCYNSIDNCMI